ncbi:MAG: hypothetical protein AAGJ83_07475 [Planctomycetota bacterium]
MALLPIRKATVDRRPTHPCPGLACGHRYRIRFSSVFCLAAACCLLLTGCGNLAYRLDRRPPAQFIPNPIETPALNDQFVWSQVVDTVDDYFRVATEQPVQNSANYVLDGRLETTYQVGSSIFEPWRKDSTSGFEAMQSTLQSIRRKATVIVRPTGAAYSIEVIVQKDLEDTDRTQYATETTATRRHDGTVVRPVGGPDDVPQTLGWISLGRDSSLEQRILRDIFNRLTKQDR